MKQLLTYFAVIALAALIQPVLATQNVETWTGGGIDSNWATPGNWSGPTIVPTSDDYLHFDGSVQTENNNNFGTNFSVGQIIFNAGADSFHLEGNAIAFFNTNPLPNLIENDSPNAQRIDFENNGGFTGNAAITLSGVNATVNAAAGDINFTQINIELENFGGGVTLTFDGAFNTTLTGAGLGIYDVFGPGSVVKNGTGTLTFFDDNNYQGGTTINDGVLAIGSANSLGIVNTFGGSNDVVLNGGQLQTILNTPIVYNVPGDFDHNGGTLFVQIGSNVTGVNNDEMLVNGAANLDPANSLLFVHRVAGSTQIFAPGDTVTIISTNNGVNGQFSDAPPGSPAPNDFHTLIQPFAVYNLFTVDLVFDFAASFASIGKTPNQIATGEALDDALAAGCIVNATTVLGNVPINLLRHVYDLIAPEELASMYEASFSQGMEQSLNIQRRLDDVRWGATGFCNEGFAITDNHGYSKDGKSVADKNPVEQTAPPNYNWGSFITGYGELSKVGEEGDNAAGYQLNTAGFTMGADYRFGDSVALGIAGGYTHTTGRLVDDGHLNTDGGRIGLYGTWYADGFYVDGSAMGGWNQYDTRRTAYLGQERGSTNGAEFDGMVAAGYDWKSGCWIAGPIADFEYSYVQFDAFTEGDTSLIPLHYPDQNQNAYRSDLGFRIAHQQNYKPGEGLNVVPEVRVAWRHDFGPTSYAIDSNFVGCDETFTVHGPYTGRDSAVVNIGLTAYCTQQLSAYINYDGQFGRDNYNNNAISGGIRYDF